MYIIWNIIKYMKYTLQHIYKLELIDYIIAHYTYGVYVYVSLCIQHGHWCAHRCSAQAKGSPSNPNLTLVLSLIDPFPFLT